MIRRHVSSRLLSRNPLALGLVACVVGIVAATVIWLRHAFGSVTTTSLGPAPVAGQLCLGNCTYDAHGVLRPIIYHTQSGMRSGPGWADLAFGITAAVVAYFLLVAPVLSVRAIRKG